MARLTRSLLTFALLVFAGGALGVACGGPVVGGSCQFDPQCGSGGVGAWCDRHADCAFAGGYCCDSKNCGGGMCTYECDGDVDCPLGMLCEHDVCWYECRDDDRDCAVGQECDHGRVCEWD